MNLVTVPLSTLVERALKPVRGPYEVGQPVVRAASLDAVQNTFTLSTLVAPTTVLEFGTELMYVTLRSNDPNPVYTVIRGYFGTTAVTHGANEPGLISPTFTRRAAMDGVISSINAIDAVMPIVVSQRITPVDDPAETVEGRTILPMPEETREVWEVRYGLDRLPRWYLEKDLPTVEYSTGKVIRLPYGWPTDKPLLVTYSVPYRWSSFPDEPDETASIDLPEEAAQLPALYASAWLLSGREVSRHDIDRSEEWARTEPLRGGVSGQMVQRKWQEFYRSLDEAQRLDKPLPRRPFVGVPR